MVYLLPINFLITGFRGTSKSIFDALVSSFDSPSIFGNCLNFRSAQPILDACNRLLSKDVEFLKNYPSRNTLISNVPDVSEEWHKISSVDHAHFESSIFEIEFIAKKICSLVQETKDTKYPIKLNNIAILVRNNSDAEFVIDSLTNFGVLCSGVGLSKILHTDIVKLLISFVSALLNPSLAPPLYHIVCDKCLSFCLF